MLAKSASTVVKENFIATQACFIPEKLLTLRYEIQQRESASQTEAHRGEEGDNVRFGQALHKGLFQGQARRSRPSAGRVCKR